MKTSTRSSLQVFTVISIALLMYTCQKSAISKQQITDVPAADALTFEEQAYEVPLYIGQNELGGSVVVNNDDNYLYVTFNTQDDWKILVVQTKAENAFTYAVTSSKDIAPGQFPFNRSFTYVGDDINLLLNSYTFTIPLSSINGVHAKKGDQAKVFAHATLVKYNANGTIAAEGAWAGEIKRLDGHKFYGEITYNMAEIEGIK